MKNLKHRNQFTDDFNFLTDAKQNIKNLRKNINYALNRVLPTRILSKANIFNMVIKIAQDLSSMIMLSVEDSLVESNILIAQKELSVRGLATFSGHQAMRAKSSSGTVKISYKPMAFQRTPIINYVDLILKCEQNNLMYIAKFDTTTSNQVSELLDIIEGRYVYDEFIAFGDSLEQISLDDNIAIENDHIEVEVNGVKFTKFNSLYDMKSTSKGFITKNSIGEQVDIIFGDNINGVKINEGDKVRVKYLLSNGELGNLDNLDDVTFKIVSGTYDINGNAVDINDDIEIKPISGFVLGSHGEDIERTRAIAGYNSRSLVFTRPENITSYLSRLSILSHIDVWTDLNSNVYKILLLPNIYNKLNEFRDYLKLPILDFTLNDNQKNSIIQYLNQSDGQATSTELMLVDPKFKKYIIFVYVTGNIVDERLFKSKVENNISQVFLENTLLDVDIEANGLITQNEILQSIVTIDGVTQCNISIISEENEIARINQEYVQEYVEFNGATKTVKTRLVLLEENENPNLGFNELGGIITSKRNHIPILKGGFKKYNYPQADILLDNGIYIFYKKNGTYEAL